MVPEFQKHRKVSLRDAGKDEKWLQAQIAGDPSILGLGDLTLLGRERIQSSGGRVDILLSDPETETMYEVEIMLGATDPSHIIRTIEYWDVESRRYPNREHRAVIVAEEITNRFFNVIWLLNRSLPIIAIQSIRWKSTGSCCSISRKYSTFTKRPRVTWGNQSVERPGSSDHPLTQCASLTAS